MICLQSYCIFIYQFSLLLEYCGSPLPAESVRYSSIDSAASKIIDKLCKGENYFLSMLAADAGDVHAKVVRTALDPPVFYNTVLPILKMEDTCHKQYHRMKEQLEVDGKVCNCDVHCHNLRVAHSKDPRGLIDPTIHPLNMTIKHVGKDGREMKKEMNAEANGYFNGWRNIWDMLSHC